MKKSRRFHHELTEGADNTDAGGVDVVVVVVVDGVGQMDPGVHRQKCQYTLLLRCLLVSVADNANTLDCVCYFYFQCFKSWGRMYEDQITPLIAFIFYPPHSFQIMACIEDISYSLMFSAFKQPKRGIIIFAQSCTFSTDANAGIEPIFFFFFFCRDRTYPFDTNIRLLGNSEKTI